MSNFTLPVPEYDASKFSWTGTKGTTCASDLGLRAGKLPHSQCYNDACDEGLRLINHQRGTSKEYYFVKYDDQCWQYKSLAGTAEGSLNIFND